MKKRFALKIHPAGLLLFAFYFLFADSHMAVAAAAALVLHEGAHVLTMKLFRMNGCLIEVTPFGGMIDARKLQDYAPWKQAAAAAAGVIASIIAACVSNGYQQTNLFMHSFYQANLSLVLINALPLWPLDGARVITALAMYTGMERGIKKLFSMLTIAAGISFVALGLYGTWKGIINPSLLAAGPYLCYAARAEMVSTRVRNLDGAKQKFSNNSLMPVEIWAAEGEKITEYIAPVLSRIDENRYQLLLSIDPTSGAVQKCWTEQEILNYLLSDGRN